MPFETAKTIIASTLPHEFVPFAIGVHDGLSGRLHPPANQEWDSNDRRGWYRGLIAGQEEAMRRLHDEPQPETNQMPDPDNESF